MHSSEVALLETLNPLAINRGEKKQKLVKNYPSKPLIVRFSNFHDEYTQFGPY